MNNSKKTKKQLIEELSSLQKRIADLRALVEEHIRVEETLKDTIKLSWSDKIYRIFGLKPKEFKANYEAFLRSPPG